MGRGGDKFFATQNRTRLLSLRIINILCLCCRIAHFRQNFDVSISKPNFVVFNKKFSTKVCLLCFWVSLESIGGLVDDTFSVSGKN